MSTAARVAAAVAFVAVVVLAFILLRGEEPGTPEVAEERPAAGEAKPAAPPAEAPPPGQASGSAARATFDVVRVAPGGAAVIAGRTEPGAEVTVRAGEEVVGVVTADRRGEWVLVPPEPLKSGAIELRQEVRVPGAEPFEAEQVVVVVVPEALEGASRQQPLVLKPSPEGGASELLQGPKPGIGVAAIKGLSLGTVDYDEQGDVVLAGVAEPGASVRAYIDNKMVGMARVGAEGTWQLEPVEPIPPGDYTLRIDQLGVGGKVVARLEMPFSRAGAAELTLVAGQVVVQPGNSLWRIARAVYGQGVRYSVIYQANRDQIRDADLIYPGQVFALPDAD